MNIQEKLTNAGYKKWVSQSSRVFKSTDTLFQKCVRDADGNKKYYIDCWWYPEQVINGHTIQENWQFEVQFNGVSDDATMNVMLFEKDIDKAEEMFEDVWTKLDLGYYEKY